MHFFDAGGNRSAALWAKRDSPYQLVDPPNSIMSRTELLLRYAAKYNATGSGAWATFLSSRVQATVTAAGARRGQHGSSAGGKVAPSGQAMDWSKIVLAGAKTDRFGAACL